MKNHRSYLSIWTIVLLSACCGAKQNEQDNGQAGPIIGDKNSTQRWVYLSGLTHHLNTGQEQRNKQVLDRIGKNLRLSFIVIVPQNRCAEFNHMLCWPHNSKEDVLNTYQQIMQSLNNQPISGFVGFSNGGFFLNRLVQFKELNVPVISIGAGVYFQPTIFHNKVYLLIGKQDLYHYSRAKQMYEQAKKSISHVQLIEYEGGHEINQKALEALFATF